MAQLTGTANFPVDRTHVVSNAGDNWAAAKTQFDLGGPVVLYRDGVVSDPGIDVLAITYDVGTNKYSLTLSSAAPGSGPLQARLDFDYLENGTPLDNVTDSPLTRIAKTNRRAKQLDIFSFTPNTTKEAWIGKRNTSIVGRGTKENPINGATKANFDAFMATRTNDSIVHLYDEAFDSDGDSGWLMKKGMKIVGAGRKSTLIKINAAYGAGGGNMVSHGIHTDPNADGGDALVEGLTIDSQTDVLRGNYGTDNLKSNAVLLRGSRCQIRSVRIIHCKGKLSSLLENFALWIDGYMASGVWQSVTDALIEDCVIEDSDGDYGGAVSLANSGNAVNGATLSGRALNNLVRGWTGTACYGFIGTNIDFIGNQAIDCALFAYTDTGTSENIRFLGNHAIVGVGSSASGAKGFLFVNSGMGAVFKGIAVVANEIVLNSYLGDTEDAVALARTTDIDGLKLLANNVRLDPRSTGTRYFKYILTGRNIAIHGNDYDRPYQLYIGSTCENVVVNEVYDRREAVLAGSLKVEGTISAAGGTFYYGLPGIYTPVAGDRLRVEVFCDDANPALTPLILVYGTYVNDYRNGMVDQNVTLPADALPAPLARGRWLFRDFDLTAFATKTIDGIALGHSGLLSSGLQNPTGLYRYYFRNLQIVNSVGAPVARYYTEPVKATPTAVSGASYASASIVSDLGSGGGGVGGGGGSFQPGYQSVSVSSAGNTNSGQAVSIHSIKFALASGSYTATLSLPVSGRTAGDLVEVRVEFPATAGPVAQIFNNSTGGTKLFERTSVEASEVWVFTAVFNGTGFELKDAHQIV